MGSMEQEIELKMGHQGHGGVAALKRILLQCMERRYVRVLLYVSEIVDLPVETFTVTGKGWY